MIHQAFIQAQEKMQRSTSIALGLLQRKCDKCHKKKSILQRSAVSSAPEAVPPIVHDVLRSPGAPLDAQTRAFMEPRFGHDFSRVRVHTDAQAAESARAVNALAYTVGGEYRIWSRTLRSNDAQRQASARSRVSPCDATGIVIWSGPPAAFVFSSSSR